MHGAVDWEMEGGKVVGNVIEHGKHMEDWKDSEDIFMFNCLRMETTTKPKALA